jgi:hypothetical protein
VAKDVLESHLGGPVILKKIITQMNGYISETEDNYSYLAEMAFEHYAAPTEQQGNISEQN